MDDFRFSPSANNVNPITPRHGGQSLRVILPQIGKNQRNNTPTAVKQQKHDNRLNLFSKWLLCC